MSPPPRLAALRLSLFYAALFSVIGTQLPFWPVWLEWRGLSETEIGVILSSAFWAKVVTNPAVGHLVDRHGRRRATMIALAAGALACFALFSFADGFFLLLGLNVIGWGLFAALMPLAETLTLSTVEANPGRRVDYGRIRLWGSLSFIAAAAWGGWLLEDHSPALVLWMMLGGLGLCLLIAPTLPDPPSPRRAGPTPPWRHLLGDRRFLAFLGAASLAQAGHTVYYAFGTLHWQAAGLGENLIGVLWAIGVVAEIALFAFGAPVVRRLGPAGLLLAAAGAGVVRWLILAATTDPLILLPAQTLHAASFGCTHLAAMHFIRQAVPGGLTVRAQSLYSSIAMGLVMGLVMLASGHLYQALGGGAFVVSAAIAGAGGMLALWLHLNWKPGQPVAREAG
ncbi:MFS transporter [Roseospirillum parvum]|uniref:MFS transporter, PPP family, 3-phenylpropionic acid transporter n=1 Tax=Roseospirillum parvum TaxID=83401 RepID=A0A1G8E8Z7_9PROT|nr:MFS transporter [Roseospirillum parvum]SDH66321.1 MFS transporter, PPP family, 3-phenylpropionic acid transporter [Roseospirillum parvum]